MKNLLFILYFSGLSSWIYAQNPYESLTNTINTPTFTEYAPTVSADGKTLFFEGDREGAWRIYESKFINNQWTTPKSIPAISNFGRVNDLIGGPSVSYDGNTLFFFASFEGGNGREDIYYSTRQGEAWSEPQNLGSPINTATYEGFPSISADGKKLYFIRENLTSEITDKSKQRVICYKIFVSEKDKNGQWQTPEALPDPINLDCEKAPRIMSDNRTLIFSSIRQYQKDKLDFDLFISKMDDEGNWLNPQPLTFANTLENDYFASVAASGDMLYYNRYANQKGDIAVAPIPPDLRQNRNITIQGFITDAHLKKGIVAQIYIRDAQTTERIMELQSASDGRYTAVISEGKKYNIEVTRPNYSSYTFDFDLSKLEAYQEFERNIEIFAKVNLLLTVNDVEIYEPIKANVKVIDFATNQEISQLSTKTDANGRQILQLPIGKKYLIQTNAEEYIDSSLVFDLTSVVKYQAFERDIEMRPRKINYAINVSDLESNDGVPLEVVLVNKNRNERIILTPEMAMNGNYNLKVREGDEYEVEIKIPKGYAFFDEVAVNDAKKRLAQKNKLDIKLIPIKPNTKLELYGITFASGSAELNENCLKELNRILSFLRANPSLKIEVAAHTDNKSTKEFNQALSVKRAKSVEQFLLSHAIAQDRLVAKGYGMDKPLVENDSPENMAINRRFELIVISL
jgi:outer membrane protein OmpA-like peptidoglycan-associated protein/Tol biopolymer transport system component